ncbi:hypothetical protein KK141_08740 [Dyella sp. LX-66]|uniref:hypothetical protein n=1 Tax=unclassified Dyella TaxID=2634549 RepID=UPI001BDF7AD1|nr:MULTISPECIES: hypothetical protein [unclassified Dyella]MBT2115802.1 hypothetical protein [Dyella sp. LX-1]MBT2139617.1 hypothetical protein [Dyella sp. LX-66]
MDQYCLVLTGRLLPGHDPDSAHARMAEAFGMQGADFRKRVFERAPLLIRRGLELSAAQAQAAQLEDMGVEAQPEPDDAPLVWLLRMGQVRGPLPESALARYAEAGDQWCHDGGQQWFPWPPSSAGEPLPPPLPTDATHAMPPPIPAATAPSRTWRVPGWAIAVLVIAAAGLALWLYKPAPAAAPEAAQRYVPRPLQPLEFEDDDDGDAAVVTSANAGQCAAAAPTARSDEDRFLLTGGQRLLTGRAQRKGDTYVAEAAASFDRACHPSSLQLYVFRSGVFIGTALENAAGAASEKLADFKLDDDQHLSVTLVPCKGETCGTPAVLQVQVLHSASGWMVRR